MKIVKVAHFVECWLPQTETWIYSHIRLLPADVESYIVCQWKENSDQFPAPNLYSLDSPPCDPGPVRRVLRRLGLWENEKRHLNLLESVIRQVRPDVLHSHFGHYGWINGTLARKHGIPHVVSFYGLDVSYLPKMAPRWASRYRRISELVDLILCEGPHMAWCLAQNGVDPAKIKVFRLGVELSRIPFGPRRRADGRPVRFLIAGSFREKKGIPYALDALALLRRRFPDIQVTVIGESSSSKQEEAEKRRILERVDRWNLRDIVQFLGYQPHNSLIEQYYKHDVFLSPSVTAANGDTEGGAPVTIIEAAASGMPVVSTLHCDIPFVVSDKNREYLVAERDPVALCRAIELLLARSDWTEIAIANRRFIEEELDVIQQASKLAGAYASLAGRWHGPAARHAH